MTQTTKDETSRREGGVRAITSGVLAAAFLGALWGALEMAGRLAVYRFGDVSGALREIPTFTAIDAAGGIVLAGFEYALVGAAIGLAASLLLRPIVFAFREERGRAYAAFVAPRFAIVFVAIFLNLFWFSRYLFQFAYGEPFHSPKRLALSLALAVLAVGIAAWIARRLERLPHAPSRLKIGLLALILGIGGGFLVRERSLLDDGAFATRREGQRNLVLFVVDTLRADRLGCYGYSRPTSPRIDRIAADATVFERFFVHAPYTWTSFGSLFTGKYPRRHGLLKMDPTVFFSPKRNMTLQRVLNDRGYRTGAFLTGMLSNASGLIEGFESYFESTIARDVVDRRSIWTFFRSELLLRMLVTKARKALDPSLVADEAVDWIADNADRPFFALIHLYSTHTPYDPPDEFDVFSAGYRGTLDRFTHDHAEAIALGRWNPTAEDVQRINDLYDGGVLQADAMIGGVFEFLARENLLEHTVFAITSDHGEELGEHGLWEHNWMYNTNQHVPLIVWSPDGLGRGVRVDVPIEQIDVMPTLLDLLDVPLPPLPPTEALDGETLLPWMRGERPRDDDFAFCENMFYLSVQNRDWKLVMPHDRAPDDPPRLYHLTADPGETVNVYREHPKALAPLLAAWEEFQQRMPKVQETESVPESRIVLEMLRQGGYTSGVSVREGKLEAEREKRDASRGERGG
jgi:arylsulfatase A-like enzyme